MADRSGTESLPTGIRIREGSIQIYFMCKRQRYEITLPHPPTAQGISAAVKIRSDLITKAKWGVLSDQDIAEAKGDIVEEEYIITENAVLFQEIAQKYLKFLTCNEGTKNDYRKILQHHWMPYFALTPIVRIRTEDIEEVIFNRDFQTAKTLNNCLTPLRGVFETAVKGKDISENPTENIKNRKVQVEVPDPFSRKEMNAVLDWLDKNLEGLDRFYYWYYELAFWTGCRPSEMIALRESDIDWFNKTFRINKSRVRGIEKNVTKTKNVREVYLNDRSERALRELVNFKNEQDYRTDYLMLCPETKEPFYNEKPPRLRLIEAMKGCMIRHRPAYNSRHTYATMLLMDGVNPVFVANQLGHSISMLEKRYAKWIHGEQNRIEISKLNTSTGTL